MKPNRRPSTIVAFVIASSVVALSVLSVVVASPSPIRSRVLPAGDKKKKVDDEVFLRTNERLYADSSIVLNSYGLFLLQDRSGRLVLYEGKGGGKDVKEENVVWSNGVEESSSWFYTHLQGDGHLLTKDESNGDAVVWKTSEYGDVVVLDDSEEYRFALKEDRTAVYVARGGKGGGGDPKKEDLGSILWSESTKYNALARNVLLRSSAGDDELNVGESVELDDARLVVEDDGNVALYDTSRASVVFLWETDRRTKNSSVRLEDDGRLVVRGGDGGKNDDAIVWASRNVVAGGGGGPTIESNRWFLVLTRDDDTGDPNGMAVREGSVDFPGDVVWSTTTTTTTTAVDDDSNAVTTPAPSDPTTATTTTTTSAENDSATTTTGSTASPSSPSTTIVAIDDDAERTATCAASVSNATTVATTTTIAYEYEIRLVKRDEGSGDDISVVDVISVVRALERALLDALATHYLRCDDAVVVADDANESARRLRGIAMRSNAVNATAAEEEGGPTKVSTLPPDEVEGDCGDDDNEASLTGPASTSCYLVRGGFTATHRTNADVNATTEDYLDFIRGAFDDGTLLRAIPDVVILEDIRFRDAPKQNDDKQGNGEGGDDPGPSATAAAVRDPTTSSQDGSDGVDAGLVGGVLGVLVAIGLVASASFLILRRRKRGRRWDRSSSPRSKARNGDNTNDDDDSEDTQEEFSPNNDDDDDVYDDDGDYKGAPSDAWLDSEASSLDGVDYAFSLDGIEEEDDEEGASTDAADEEEERGGFRDIRRNIMFLREKHTPPVNLLPPRPFDEDDVALDSDECGGGVVVVRPSDRGVSSVRGTDDDDDEEEAGDGPSGDDVVQPSARFVAFDSAEPREGVVVRPTDRGVPSVRGTDDGKKAKEATDDGLGSDDDDVVRRTARFLREHCASLDSVDDADPGGEEGGNGFDDEDIRLGARVLREECKSPPRRSLPSRAGDANPAVEGPNDRRRASTADNILRDLRERGSVLPSDPARSGEGRGGGEGGRRTSRPQGIPTTSATTTREEEGAGGTEGVLSPRSRSYRSDETYRSWQVKTRDADLDGYENDETGEV